MEMNEAEVSTNLKKGKLTIGVIGVGRIGLPTAAVFADAGAKVIGADSNKDVVEAINHGETPIDEPGLKELVEQVVRVGKLKATTNVVATAKISDALIVCVPTPVDESKTPDYSSLESACQAISGGLRKGSLIIIESTVSPNTVESRVIPILEDNTRMQAGRDFGVASCPERADPGNILVHLKTTPRIVGGINAKSTEIAAALYKAALGVQVVKLANPKTANAVKLTENIFRDVNIALMNELAILYEKLGIDIIEVINAAATKWNFVPHYPGVGVGGPCLPANPYYLIQEGQKVGYIPHIVRMAREVNDRMPEHVVGLVLEALNSIGKTAKNSKVAILGVTYKPGVRDIQNTPVEPVIMGLRKLGANVACYDPFFKNQELFKVKLAGTLADAVKVADCIVLCTAHSEFQVLNFNELAKLAHKPAAFIDARGVVDPVKVLEAGLIFRGVGRAAVYKTKFVEGK